jgi:hypothetical protein
MRSRTLALLAIASLGITTPVSGQDGLRVPERAVGSGLDPSYATGWWAERERLGFAPNNWRDAIGFTPTARVQWSYPLGQYSVGMSLANGRDYEGAPIFGAETRQYGLMGRYMLSADWSVNAEAMSREPGALLRLQDFRIGLRRQF